MGNEPSRNNNNGNVQPTKPSRAPIALHPAYTVRVVVKGERSVGKTAIVSLLRDHMAPFVELYAPTKVSEVSYVDWTFKSKFPPSSTEYVLMFFVAGTNEKVRLQVTEYVDVVSRPASQELKIAFDAPQEQQQQQQQQEQDNSALSNAHALILVFDPRKPWTYDYVKQEITTRVTNNKNAIDVLVIANFRDAQEQWQIKSEEVREFIREDIGGVRYLECSAKDGFGKTQVKNSFQTSLLRLHR